MEINDEPPPPHHRGATAAAAAAASSAAATAMASVAASLKTAAAGSAEQQMQMLRKVITPKANANAAAAAAANNNNNNSHIFHSSFPPLSSPSSPSSLSPPLSPPLSPSSAVTSSAYRWNTTTTSTSSGSDSSVINLWAPGNVGSSDNSSSSSSLVTTNIVTAFKNFQENSSRTIADLQSHLGSDWNDWSSSSGENFTSGGRGTSITSDSFSYFSNTGGNYTSFLNESSRGVNQQPEALLTWWDVWLGKPFPSGYTQLAIVLLAFFLTCIMILVVVGNLLVCIAIATEKSLKPVQNWFIASLAVSDLLIGLVIMPFSLARELMGYWMFGQIWCDVHAALDVLLCTASINSLFLISLDRYWSITQAVKYLKKRTPSRAAFMIAFVWIFSALVSLPPLVGWKKAEQSSEYPQCNLSDDIGYVL